MKTKNLSKQYIKTLLFFTIFCFLFLFIRNAVVKTTEYNFLVWNLFLGFVPFAFALPVFLFRDKLNKITTLILGFLWFIFYPNAPYMITDFIHVQANSSMVVYDALLIFSFAMLSLYFGFYSLMLFEVILKKHMAGKYVKAILLATMLLSSFGIYLGRVLRLNSWDIFSNFTETINQIFSHLFPVNKNPVTYVMILLFTIIQIVMLKSAQNIDQE